MEDQDFLSEWRARLEELKRARERRLAGEAELLRVAEESPLGGPLYEDPDAFEASRR